MVRVMDKKFVNLVEDGSDAIAQPQPQNEAGTTIVLLTTSKQEKTNDR